MNKTVTAFFIAPLFLVAPVRSYAVIADNFECVIGITDNAGNKTTQTAEIAGIRHPLNASPSPNVRETATSSSVDASLEGQQQILHADLRIQYTHAVRIDYDGRVV